MPLYDSIIPCFGSRLTVVMMPTAKRYRVFPLGTFHYFDWQKSEEVGISIGTCPQIVSSETAKIGIRVGNIKRILPYDAGKTFSHIKQSITPLQTIFEVSDSDLGIEAKFAFRSAFYPKSFEFSSAPCYQLTVEVSNPTDSPVETEIFFGIPIESPSIIDNKVASTVPIHFPKGIDHTGIEDLTFEQIITGDSVSIDDSGEYPLLKTRVNLMPSQTQTVNFYHVGYIPQPTLNQQGNLLKFGYTTLWQDADDVLRWWQTNNEELIRKGNLFESTVLDATVAPELKMILASSFKGLASNAWWAENDWFSLMEIGAYHSTLDVDFQLALFFFHYWEELIGRMLKQWTMYYRPQSGYMAHDVGQHLEATGNRYGGDGSAMKVEENCNYLILLHHYWRSTNDTEILDTYQEIIVELVDFLIAADTNGSGLPNRFADNTNDWGSGLITTSEEQSYHGVRLVVAYTAVTQFAEYYADSSLQTLCLEQIEKIKQVFKNGWLGDHYPISFSDQASYQHYSMWTTHGLLYALRNGLEIDLDLNLLRIDLISSTQRTMHEHGCVHSTVDVRGWLTQNLWRDTIAAYLGVDMTNNLHRYLGHGEYVSYEDTTILEVANELMVVPGAIAEHQVAGETHDFPMVDGHPRPACGFGLLYGLGGIAYDAMSKKIHFQPVSFPLRIALTHLADWENERIPWVQFDRSIPNQDKGFLLTIVTYSLENEDILTDLHIEMTNNSTRK